MSILFDGPKVDFIDITYLHLDPLDRKKQIFEYPLGVNLTNYASIYVYYNGTVTTLTSTTFSLMQNTNKLKLKIENLYGYSGLKLKLLGILSNTCGIDFIDKFGQTGTVYTYDSFQFSNDSNYTRLLNTTITSENLLLGFVRDYPAKFQHIQYTNGVPSPSISLVNVADYNWSSTGIDPTKLVGFYNNQYVGQVDMNGYFQSGFNSIKTGLLEIIYKGGLEFSLSSTGPWTTVLNIPVITHGQVITCYIRCGQLITTLTRTLNSIKIVSTEAV